VFRFTSNQDRNAVSVEWPLSISVESTRAVEYISSAEMIRSCDNL